MSWQKTLLNTPVIGDITKKVVSMKIDHDAKGIAEHFTKFLQPEVALKEELKDEVYRIRHNVYCEELGFEAVRREGKEQDEFDQQSIFCMIKHKPSNVYTSCVRIVKSQQDDELLPIEKFCLSSIQNKELHPSNFPRSEIAEISRLAVKADFRRRKTDKYVGSAIGVINKTNYSETELRCFPFIAIGLYMAAATLAMETGVKHVYVMMEPRLARSMKFVGIKFLPLGEAIEYHGQRIPYYINQELFMKHLPTGFNRLYLAIKEDIKNQLAISQA